MIDCQWEEYAETVRVCGPDGCRRVEQQRLRCTNPGCKHKFPPIRKNGLCKFPLDGKRPRWNCEYQPDVLKTAEKLDIIKTYGGVPPSMNGLLAVWEIAGMPERPEEEWQRLWHAECEFRRPSGMCGAVGCPKSSGWKGRHVACLWLCRMATVDCPKGHFKKQVSDG